MMQSLSQWLLVVGGSVELSIVVKATVVVTLGLLAARLARRARASARHLILASTFVGLLILPVTIMVVPDVAIAIPISGAGKAATSPSEAPQRTSSAAVPAGFVARPRVETTRWSWSILARAGWAAGAMLLALWLGGVIWRLGRLRRRGLPWPASRPVVAALAAKTGIRRPVDVLLHEDLVAPATCGWRHPTILLPTDAPEWSEADFRRALVHELEHVRRGDWAVHLMARATSSAFWFHPLAWVAFRQLCLEAERACDDAVLQCAERTDYAAQLVQLARRLSNAPAQPTLAMANRSDLSTRVSAILDSTQSRGRLRVSTAVAAVIAAVVLVVAVAPVRAVGVYRGNRVLVSAPDVNQARQGQRRLVTALDRALYEAAEGGDLDEISTLLTAGANVNGVIDGDGSPLIGAARNGRLSAVRLLLDNGADPNRAVPGDGNPIIMAASEGHADVVELLLNRGARIDQIVPGDENALIQASGQGHLRVVHLLVARGADVNARVWVDQVWGRGVRRQGGEWRTPLNMARRGGHDTVVAYLLSVGARE